MGEMELAVSGLMRFKHGCRWFYLSGWALRSLSSSFMRLERPGVGWKRKQAAVGRLELDEDPVCERHHRCCHGPVLEQTSIPMQLLRHLRGSATMARSSWPCLSLALRHSGRFALDVLLLICACPNQ